MFSDSERKFDVHKDLERGEGEKPTHQSYMFTFCLQH